MLYDNKDRAMEAEKAAFLSYASILRRVSSAPDATQEDVNNVLDVVACDPQVSPQTFIQLCLYAWSLT